jgi:hypothetical protein
MEVVGNGIQFSASESIAVHQIVIQQWKWLARGQPNIGLRQRPYIIVTLSDPSAFGELGSSRMQATQGRIEIDCRHDPFSEKCFEMLTTGVFTNLGEVVNDEWRLCKNWFVGPRYGQG